MNNKNAIRAEMKARRKAMPIAERNGKSDAIFHNIISSELIKNADTVMCYMSAFGEPSTSLFIERLTKSGKRIVLPVTDPESGMITPSYFTGELGRGAFGIREPLPCMVADIADIDVIIVPGIAFDRRGGRIGFGKGCYDRLLCNFGGVIIGVCYDFQLIDEIPRGEHDIDMDLIITETGVYHDF